MKDEYERNYEEKSSLCDYLSVGCKRLRRKR